LTPVTSKEEKADTVVVAVVGIGVIGVVVRVQQSNCFHTNS